MATPALTAIDACVFDAYGTLFDVTSAATRLHRRAGREGGRPRGTVQSAELGALLDHVLSVEEVGVYKPHPRVYRLAVDRLHVAAGHICFVSSNGWDVAGASAFGMKAVWVNRAGAKRERLPAGPGAEVRQLDELPALVGP